MNCTGLIDEEDLPKEAIAIAEDRLRPARLCPDDALSACGAPLSGRMGKSEGDGQDGQELGDALWMEEMGVFEIEAT